MGRVILFSMLFICSLFLVDSWGGDWKFYGGCAFKGLETFTFYDTETVERLSNGNVTVWVEGLKSSEFEKEYSQNKEKIIEASAEKVAKGYIPPCVLVDKRIGNEKRIDIISWEVAAGLSQIQPLIKTLYEINCKERKVRSLFIVYYPKDNEISSSSEPSKWDYIVPETAGETLSKILCGAVQGGNH